MHLRPATISDASSIAALSIEVWIGTYLRRGINGFFADFILAEFTTSKIEKILNDPKEFVLVSDNVDGIDGFIRLSASKKAPVEGCSDTEVSTFYVQPRHHGKGLGKALLNGAIKQCKHNGITDFWLATNSENTPAIGFYLSNGFVHVGHTHFELQDQAYLNNVYSYQIPPA